MRGPLSTIFTTVAAGAAAALVAVGIVIYTGIYNVAADDSHWPLTRWVMETARVRSIKAHAAEIAVPPDLGNAARLAMGVEHFAAHCAVCHGAPGVPRGDIAHGLYPAPPDLSSASKTYSEAELFWIVKHGLKMTGMPAWRDHSDDELWATVAFIKRLGAGMNAADYAALVQANLMHGMQHHQGGPTLSNGDRSPSTPLPDPPHQH